MAQWVIGCIHANRQGRDLVARRSVDRPSGNPDPHIPEIQTRTFRKSRPGNSEIPAGNPEFRKSGIPEFRIGDSGIAIA
jgi:hypothetical protein